MIVVAAIVVCVLLIAVIGIACVAETRLNRMPIPRVRVEPTTVTVLRPIDLRLDETESAS